MPVRVRKRRQVSLEERGASHLAAGRLKIQHLDKDHVQATCRSSALYKIEFVRGKGWTCSCRGDVCPHIYAARLVADI